MHDDRLACAPTGCASPQEQPFFATFAGVHPTSATCSCNGGDHGGAAVRDDNDDAFEQMVQAITDQIMAASA